MLHSAEGFSATDGEFFFYASIGAFIGTILIILSIRKWWSILTCVPLVCLFATLGCLSYFTNVFGICSAMIADLAVLFNVKYLEMSTILNLYVQPVLLLITSIIGIIRSTRSVITSYILFMLDSILLIFVLFRYPPIIKTLVANAQQCFCDLMYISNNDYNIYVLWNIVIFILLFIIKLGWNLYALKNISRRD